MKVERVPWADGKQRSTKALGWFLAGWARRLSWKETAEVFGVSWDRVRRAVGMAVEWGRERVTLEGVTTIGVDETAWQCGHRYLTLVYQLDAGRRRLLWVGKDRKITTLESFFAVVREAARGAPAGGLLGHVAGLPAGGAGSRPARRCMSWTASTSCTSSGKAIDAVRADGGEAAAGARQGCRC